jgi:hypothetical protein
MHASTHADNSGSDGIGNLFITTRRGLLEKVWIRVSNKVRLAFAGGNRAQQPFLDNKNEVFSRKIKHFSCSGHASSVESFWYPAPDKF